MEENPDDLPSAPKKSRPWLWAALVGVILIICCIIALSVIFLERENIPIIADLFATSTPTATPTPLPVPGISEPITVEGVDLIIESAKFQTSYSAFDKTWRASEDGEILLVVEGTVFDEAVDIGKWRIKVLDDTSEEHINSVSITSIKDDHKTFTWLFAVPQISKTFTLELPDGQEIELMSILGD